MREGAGIDTEATVLQASDEIQGSEQAVLLELPAWRPSGSAGTKQRTPRGRGFVDLAGLDATGTLLLVEPELRGDHMLVLQGLDYRSRAEANRARLTQPRLSDRCRDCPEFG